MFQLFIDESGYVQKYRENTHHQPDRRYFILGGIIVEDQHKNELEDVIKKITQDYFGDLNLKDDFKLCYHGLRQCQKFPYDQLNLKKKIMIADTVFDAINDCNCKLLSAQIDLNYIYNKYIKRIPQRTLALNFITERFQYFLLDHNDRGQIIHEYATAELNKDMQTNYGRLHLTHHLPKTVEFDNVDKKIRFAKVIDEPILQFSDFFAYSVLIRAKSKGVKQSRWKSIMAKYYNLNHPNIYRRGNCSI